MLHFIFELAILKLVPMYYDSLIIHPKCFIGLSYFCSNHMPLIFCNRDDVGTEDCVNKQGSPILLYAVGGQLVLDALARGTKL